VLFKLSWLPGKLGFPRCLLSLLPQTHTQGCGFLTGRLSWVGPAGFTLWIPAQSAGSGEKKIEELKVKNGEREGRQRKERRQERSSEQ
jgi:hypothetical protein